MFKVRPRNLFKIISNLASVHLPSYVHEALKKGQDKKVSQQAIDNDRLFF